MTAYSNRQTTSRVTRLYSLRGYWLSGNVGGSMTTRLVESRFHARTFDCHESNLVSIERKFRAHAQALELDR